MPKKETTSTTVENPIMLVDSPEAKAMKPPSRDNLENVNADAIALSPQPYDAAIITPVSLAAFYAFIGANEFIRKDGDHHNIKHALKVGFADTPKTIGYGEIDLFRCCNWYKELRCADIIDNPTDDDATWNYRLVIINPSAPEHKFKKHEKYLPRVAKFKALVAKFYANGFTAGEPTMSCINMALDHDITIMIVAKKMKTPRTEWKPMWEEKNVGLKIIGAVTFSRTTPSRKKRSDVAVYISWLLIAKHEAIHPSQIDGWRRKGFGLFMIIAMIKFCFAESLDFAKNVDVFLQCYEPAAFTFYKMLGFKMINTHFDDGYALLPPHVKADLSATSAKSPKPNVAMFHFYERKDDDNVTVAYNLMHLRSGELRHFVQAPMPASQPAPSNLARWCTYPPPPVRGKPLHYSDTAMRNLFYELQMLQDLLPGPYNSVPLGAMTMTAMGTGEMLVERRLTHTTNSKVSWMASAEVDLMFAILCFDLRYQDVCCIMPAWACDSIAKTFYTYQRYQRALRLWSQEADKAKIEKAIIDRFGASLEQLTVRYGEMRQQLFELVIDPNAGMLERRLIVFPCNENQSHWSATFVFNASFIKMSANAEDIPNGLRPCFLRYCPMEPHGTRDVPVSQGILWFLNLCVSYEAHGKRDANLGETNLEWLDPFGGAVDGDMLGTETFPALRLSSKATMLPQQAAGDTFNCGFGVTATTAMLLRDVVVHDAYPRLFSATQLTLKTCSVTEERYCDMPVRHVIPFWISKSNIPWSKYLPQLRLQWFTVFDRLAMMEHEIVPQQLYADWIIPASYLSKKDDILKWPILPTGDNDAWAAKLSHKPNPAGGNGTQPPADKPAGDGSKPPDKPSTC